ncbi:MAG: ATP-binding protein [Dehalococcoidia bacterium]
MTAANYGVLDPELAIDSMRANGYMSTDTALAELIDNAVDAEASTIEVFCFEVDQTLRSGLTRPRVARIGVLDNGEGMTADLLRKSLRFGGGSREDRKKIGRFGFGLPNSSISQCNRTTVWSWRNGAGNALTSYLDVDEVKDGSYSEVPEPRPESVPDQITDLSGDVGRSGTYVEWSDLGESTTWKTGATISGHTARLVGRIYRHYLVAEEPLRIVLYVVAPDGSVKESTEVKPNDPTYLMPDTSVPWDEQPMFQEHAKHNFTFVDNAGESHVATVTLSYSKLACRQAPAAGGDAGSLPHGKHAHQNQGISIVRNGRELQLADVVQFDPYRDRWLGCEIAFPAELDEVFGVYNNKQGASNLRYFLQLFQRGAVTSYNDLIRENEFEEGDMRATLARLAQWTATELGAVAKLVKKQREGTRSEGETRHDLSTVEDVASSKFKKRAESKPTEAELRELESPTPPEVQEAEGLKSFLEKKYDEEEAKEIMSAALDRDRTVIFQRSSPNHYGREIFDIEQVGARVFVVLNQSHGAYHSLVEMLEGDRDGLGVTELQDRLEKASDNLMMLFAAWARLEVEAAPNEKKQLAGMRIDWGRLADNFLDASDD